MADIFSLRIVTPEKQYFSGDVESIEFSTSDGRVGILAHHTDFICDVAICPLAVLIYSHYHVYAVTGGVFRFEHDKNLATLFVYAIESKDEIDEERALRAKANAEELLSNAESERQAFRAEVKLKRALNRLEVKKDNRI